MKKLFAILVVVLLVVACGVGNTKNEPKSVKNEPKSVKDQPKSIEDQLMEYVAKMEKAVKADNYEEAKDIYWAYEEWVDSLDKEQLKELMEIMDKNVGSLYILDEVGSSAYNEGEPEVNMVYSNMYDGYLNVRAEPSTKSQVLGTLRNGPEGAELISVEGKWTKVRVNGVEGYVWSAYLQSEPSEPVYISASAVVGEWLWCDENAHMDSCTIESNGNFNMEGYLSMEEKGTWYLSGHNIILKYSDGRTIACNVTGNTIIINGCEYDRM